MEVWDFNVSRSSQPRPQELAGMWEQAVPLPHTCTHTLPRWTHFGELCWIPVVSSHQNIAGEGWTISTSGSAMLHHGSVKPAVCPSSLYERFLHRLCCLRSRADWSCVLMTTVKVVTDCEGSWTIWLIARLTTELVWERWQHPMLWGSFTLTLCPWFHQNEIISFLVLFFIRRNTHRGRRAWLLLLVLNGTENEKPLWRWKVPYSCSADMLQEL